MIPKITYSVNELFAIAFGLNTPVFSPDFKVQQVSLPIYENRQSEAGNTEIVYQLTGEPYKGLTSPRVGMFGHPVAFPVLFSAGEYRKFDRFGVLQSKQMEEFHLPASTMVDFSRSKILSETPQTSGEGAIVEMFGFENWSVRIRGLCIADPSHPTHKTAQAQKEALLEWEELASGIYVVGTEFTEKNIHYLVIKSISISKAEARPNVIPFEMDCISVAAPEDQIL